MKFLYVEWIVLSAKALQVHIVTVDKTSILVQVSSESRIRYYKSGDPYQVLQIMRNPLPEHAIKFKVQ